jgi:heme/copper-type cytochrome/quinol oxidase subunit 2
VIGVSVAVATVVVLGLIAGLIYCCSKKRRQRRRSSPSGTYAKRSHTFDTLWLDRCKRTTAVV